MRLTCPPPPAATITTSGSADARRLDALRAFDVTARLPEITAPTLMIYGENDPAARPETGRRIADGIPGTRLEVIPAVRHGIWLERGDLAARLRRELVLAHPVPAGTQPLHPKGNDQR